MDERKGQEATLSCIFDYCWRYYSLLDT